MSKKNKPKVKVVRVNHGLLGRSDTRRIEKAIGKWMGKGYELQGQQDEDRPGCLRGPGYTMLTFIKAE